VLVEGESDAQTLWHHEIPALGVPGADSWRDEWAEPLDGIMTVYVIVEPDRGGDTLRAKLTASPLRDRLRLVSLRPHKDASALHIAEPTAFADRFRAALDAAPAAAAILIEEQASSAAAAWTLCESLARESRILDRFVEGMYKLGAVGEERAAKIVLLSLVSRLLPRPVSIVMKGPSSAGKSFTTETALRFVPPSAFYQLSGMSERYLIYDTEPLAHRMIVIAEADAIAGDYASYIVRTLLSEGRLNYGTVEKGENGEQRARRVDRQGPTGVILTTTKIKLHTENETRLFSVPVDDTRAQTRRVMQSLAGGGGSGVDFEPWHALQEWLESGERRVLIPYAERLSQLIPPVAVRLRRDFGALLNLIRAHALLHRASREAAETGIVATIDDYVVVRELVADLIGEAAEQSVSQTIRETVAAVAALLAGGAAHVSVGDLARQLGLDKSAASRRYAAARGAGYLVNTEDKRGRPAKIVLGEPLPEQTDLLPAPEVLRCCSDFGGGTITPLPPLEAADGSSMELF
jgi:hypothetical protein